MTARALSGFRRNGSAIASGAFAILIALMAAPFALHSFGFGADAFGDALAGEAKPFRAGDWRPSIGLYAHMIAGGVITLLAPLQLIPIIHRVAPVLHRGSGYVIFGLALIAALGGLIYILGAGTIGGWKMDVAFAGYGVCLSIAAVQTVRFARARDLRRHRDWALRLFILAIGSWLYRVQYGLWEITTGGIWRAPDFSGLFDQIQLLAFYAPWLIGLEVWFRIRDRRGRHHDQALYPK